MRFITIPAIIAILFISVTSCSSRKSSCGCPYRSDIFEEKIELSGDIPLLTIASMQLDLIPEFKILSAEEFFKPQENENSDFLSNLVGYASQYQGVRYRRGGLGEKGFDCSGFVYKTYSNFGIKLPRTSYDMSRNVTDIPRQEAQVGDLIFFKTNRKRSQINHVGLVIGVKDGEIKFIHASIKKGVVVSSTREDYYARTYAKIGRVQNS